MKSHTVHGIMTVNVSSPVRHSYNRLQLVDRHFHGCCDGIHMKMINCDHFCEKEWVLTGLDRARPVVDHRIIQFHSEVVVRWWGFSVRCKTSVLLW